MIDSTWVLESTCLSSHVYALLYASDEYLAKLENVQRAKECNGTQVVKIESSDSAIHECIVSALHITSKHEKLEKFLPYCDFQEILRALERIDSRRYESKLRRMIENIESANPQLKDILNTRKRKYCDDGSTMHRKDAIAIHKHRRLTSILEENFSRIHNIHNNEDEQNEQCTRARNDARVKELIRKTKVSVPLTRAIRRWARTQLSSDYLELVMLNDHNSDIKLAWKKLVGIVKPSPTDFQVVYFLLDIHGSIIPKSSYVNQMREFISFLESNPQEDGLVVAQIFQRMTEVFPQIYKHYTFIRTIQDRFEVLNHQDIVKDLAENVPLNIALTYSKELVAKSPSSKEIILKRLDSAAANNKEHFIKALNSIMSNTLKTNADESVIGA